MPFPFGGDTLDQGASDHLVVGAAADQRADVRLFEGEEAIAQLAVGREAHAVAAHAERPADGGDQADATAAVNDRKVRALTPHIGARVELRDGSFLGVLRATPVDADAAGPLRNDQGKLLLGGLELREVQPAGGRPMDAAAYLRGRKI